MIRLFYCEDCGIVWAFKEGENHRVDCQRFIGYTQAEGQHYCYGAIVPVDTTDLVSAAFLPPTAP